jgi:tetratricopeptide (TPR) repeat protein
MAVGCENVAPLHTAPADHQFQVERLLPKTIIAAFLGPEVQVRHLIILALPVLVLAYPAFADEGHQHALSDEEIGSVQFVTSCSPQVTLPFNRAVAVLHSFQYERARHDFLEIATHDPKCAMVYWGVAMSHYHGLWDNSEMGAGREALQTAQRLASSDSRTSQREKAYIDALAEVYRQDGTDQVAHAQAFERKMGELQAAFPEDTEAAIFHALSLAITAPKTDKSFANQRKCGEILEPIFAKQPKHPGIAHYMIHCYDNPVLAEKGLPAARLYARIAPASAHANHMPSHIFTRVGSWNESIASNQRSAELAAADEHRSQNSEARDQRLHANDYLEYALLQTGRVHQASVVLEEINSLPAVPGLTLTGYYALAAVPARYALEGRDWERASALRAVAEGPPWTQAISWAAIGLGSARTGKIERAEEAEKKLATLREAARENQYWTNQIEVQRREVAAWIAEKNGSSPDALAGMRSAAELEESMDKHAVTPGPVIPAREMLAELLSMHEQWQAATDEYQTVLKTAPKRFNAVYGAARCAEKAGNAKLANEYFKELTEIAVGDERPELVEARRRLDSKTQSEAR